MTEPIRVVVADDHPLFRDGVIHSLAAEPRISMVGEAATGEAAILLAQDLLPDVILLDITMPGKDGLAASREIAATCPAVRIIILTVSENEDDLLEAFKAGARGYILKGVAAQELIDVILAVVAGDVYVSPLLAAGMLVEMTRSQPPDPLGSLTEREQQILQLLSQGLTNREIGERLYLSEKTVKHYMTNILGKLHVKNRLEAALLATRRGLG